MKKFSILLGFLCIGFFLQAQGIGVNSYAMIRLDNHSNGHQFELYYRKMVKNDLSIKLSLGHRFTGSNAVKPNPDYNKGIRTFDNIKVDYFSPFWDTELSPETKFFPGVNLSNRTNRYFSFDIEGHMEKEVALLGKKLNIGVGLVASWKDEMQVERYIEVDSIVFIISSLPPLYKRLIPVYSYTTFWDFGASLQAEYNLIEWRKLHILYSTKMLYFPKSQAFSVGLGLDLSLDF